MEQFAAQPSDTVALHAAMKSGLKEPHHDFPELNSICFTPCRDEKRTERIGNGRREEMEDWKAQPLL